MLEIVNRSTITMFQGVILRITHGSSVSNYITIVCVDSFQQLRNLKEREENQLDCKITDLHQEKYFSLK